MSTPYVALSEMSPAPALQTAAGEPLQLPDDLFRRLVDVSNKKSLAELRQAIHSEGLHDQVIMMHSGGFSGAIQAHNDEVRFRMLLRAVTTQDLATRAAAAERDLLQVQNALAAGRAVSEITRDTTAPIIAALNRTNENLVKLEQRLAALEAKSGSCCVVQ